MTQGDFSSGVLMQLIQASFKHQGILENVLPEEENSDLLSPRVGLSFKRSLLKNAFSRYGYGPILQAGLDIRSMQDSPLGYALLRAKTVEDLLTRFFRLEKYFHSKHRLVIRKSGQKYVCLRHISTTADPPQIYEDLIIAGLITGILSLFGCRDIDLECQGVTLIESGAVEESVTLCSDCSEFTIRWSDIHHVPGPAYDGKQHFLNSLTAAGSGHISRKTGCLIASDPVRNWSLAEIAQECGLSTRTLQRRLKEEGSSFSKCVMAARCQCAVYYMTEAIENLAAVGFLAGFSDAAHFSREFRKTMGLLPSDFRTSIKAP